MNFNGHDISETILSNSTISGHVTLGKHTLVEDNVRIRSYSDKTQTHAITIENLFECGCIIESTRTRNGNVFESKAIVKRGSTIGNNCDIGQCVVIEEEETIEDETIITCVTDRNNQKQGITRRMQSSLIKAHR